MWNNSHRIPTESLQKILYNQSCKKDPYVYNEGKREKRRNHNRTCTPGNLLHYLGNVLKHTGSIRVWRGESASWPVALRVEKEQQKQSWPPCCMSQLETCTCWCVQ